MKLRQQITSVMSDPRRVNKTSPLAWLLWFLSKGYGAGVAIRNRRFCSGANEIKKLPCTIISVGNIAAGGVGKTPVTLYLARLFQQAGKQAAVVSRGYKGNAGKKGAVVSNGRQVLLKPSDAGDEPFLMAHYLDDIPIIVGHDRYEAGKKAIEKFNPEIILLDDGFQHQRLFRDINIVLLDARLPFGNTHLLPRGILREPLSALERADIFILTRFGSSNRRASLEALLPAERPVFRSDHRPSVRKIIASGNRSAINHADESHSLYRDMKKRNGFAFSGIARNEEVRRSIQTLGFSLKGFFEFPDHHAYSGADLKKITGAARKSGADFLITTDKDSVRISEQYQWPMDLVVIGVDIDFGSEQTAFETCLFEMTERIPSS